MTIDQKKSTDKLHSIYKDLIKNQKVILYHITSN